MKRRPLIIIACIASVCFIGICLTLFTKSYISSKSVEYARRDADDRRNIVIEENLAVEGAADENPAEETEAEMAETEAAVVLAEAGEEELPVPELKTYIDVAEVKKIEAEKELVQYLEKLAGLEEQIDFSWEALNSEKSKPSVQQEQAVADLSYKIWDDELNLIYKMLREKLPEEEFETLKKEERLWLKTRDEAAEAMAVGVSNVSVQKLRYTLSLSDTTKERTYELVELYFNEE